MRFFDYGNQFVRKYDFCYYLIKPDTSIKDPIRIYFKLNKAYDMNVYIWEGQTRDEATKAIVFNNANPNIGQTYSVSGDSGILVVSYPNQNAVDTELSFDFWVTAPEESKPVPVPDTTPPDD